MSDLENEVRYLFLNSSNATAGSLSNFSFLFNQSAFNNDWRAGGVSSMAGNLAVNYDFNYKTSWLIGTIKSYINENKDRKIKFIDIDNDKYISNIIKEEENCL